MKAPNFWMQTYTGVVFDLEHPTPDMVKIEDIAHHLSLTNRFNGATDRHYSVAQHCTIVARWVEGGRETKLAALLHDAHEAYTGDLIAPLKFLLARETSAFIAIEGRIQDAINDRFHLSKDLAMWEHIKKVDLQLLLKERDLLLSNRPCDWDLDGRIDPLPVYIETLRPEQAERDFLRMYSDLMI